ncbi:hypothetical protein QS257_02600 [Terrilactibacillus sp. S3-3]|nr:hypothetical protein QS257_02600 [Terrilactibacillus sp. S3-3]
MDTFIRKLDSRLQTRLINLMKRYHSIGFSVVASGNVPEWKGYDPLIVELKNTKDALLLVRKKQIRRFLLCHTQARSQSSISGSAIC